MSIWPASMTRNVPRETPVCSSVIPRPKRMTAPRLMACLLICIGLALPSKTLAEETASGIIAQTGLTHTATAQTVTANADTSAALLRVIALRQELVAQVKALSRLVAYQKELLALANTRDVDAVLRARRARQTCLAEIGTAALCDALSVSFTDDPTVDDPTVQDRGDGG